MAVRPLSRFPPSLHFSSVCFAKVTLLTHHLLIKQALRADSLALFVCECASADVFLVVAEAVCRFTRV